MIQTEINLVNSIEMGWVRISAIVFVRSDYLVAVIQRVHLIFVHCELQPLGSNFSKNRDPHKYVWSN